MNERLVTFIYNIVAHHAPAMAVEEMVTKAEITPVDMDPPDVFDETHIERFAREMALRIEKDVNAD